MNYQSKSCSWLFQQNPVDHQRLEKWDLSKILVKIAIKRHLDDVVFDSSDDGAYDDADNVFILDVQVGVGPAGFSAIAPWLSTEIQLPHTNTHLIVVIIILVELMIDVWLWGSSDYIGEPASPIKRFVSRMSRYEKPKNLYFQKNWPYHTPFAQMLAKSKNCRHALYFSLKKNLKGA